MSPKHILSTWKSLTVLFWICSCFWTAATCSYWAEHIHLPTHFFTLLHLSIPPSLNPLNSILSWFCLFFSPCHLNSFSHTYGLRRQHDMSGGFRRIPVLLSRDKVSALTLISSTRSFLSLLSKQSICAFCRPDSFPTPLCLWLRLFLLTPDVVQTFIHVGWGLLTLVFLTRLLQKGCS